MEELFALFMLKQAGEFIIVTKIRNAHHVCDGFGNLGVFDGAVIEQLCIHTVCKHGDVCAGVRGSGVVKLALFISAETARFVVGGDDHKGVGIIEGVFHYESDHLIEANHGAEDFFQDRKSVV